MTEQETIKCVTLIVMSYPASEIFKDENTVKAMVSVWKKLFKDDDPALVELAIQKHIATSKWPPNVAEIREQMVSIGRPDIISPDVAWGAVSDLLAVPYQNDLSILPPLVRRCVETIGWSALKEMHRGVAGGSKPGMDRVTFIQQYTPMYERERERAMLPKALSEAAANIERSLGGEVHRQIEAAHQKRIEEEREWDKFSQRLSSEDGQKFIGG